MILICTSAPVSVCAEQVYPSKYDLREKNLISPPADQNESYTCWAFSFLGSFETKLAKSHPEVNLSEWYMTHSAFTGNYGFPVTSTQRIASGSGTIAASVLTGWRGIALEKDIPYGTAKEAINKYNINNLINNRTSPDYILTDIRGLEPWISSRKHYDTNYIKDMIYSDSSVYCTCTTQDKYFNTAKNALYCSNPDYTYKSDSGYHSVLLVGWDDNFKRENFSENCRPENDGAWIAKNSYGADWGYDGYFYISYEDQSLLEAVACTGAEKNPYQNIYQHDEYGWSTSLSSEFICSFFPGSIKPEKNAGHMANIFQADSDEYIAAVSICTIEDDAEYELSVYTGLSDISSPVSGTEKSYLSGRQAHRGYHTLTLTEPVPVMAGEYFSVVLKIINPSSEFTIPIEACIQMRDKNNDKIIISNISSIDKKIHRNESFISEDGVNWHDIFITSNGDTPLSYRINEQFLPDPPEDEYPEKMTGGNICMKVFSLKDLPDMPTPGFDINNDGSATALDISEMLSLISEKKYITNADLNHDGEITAADLVILISALLTSD